MSLRRLAQSNRFQRAALLSLQSAFSWWTSFANSYPDKERVAGSLPHSVV
jgi:hypothetical protein